MLRGHVFKFQTFANEAFAHFINTFLDSKSGITKGCELSNTNTSVTIDKGYFCIYGRFLEIVGNNTITDLTADGYYQLVCEIDLEKENTASSLNQAEIKTIKNSSSYTTLTQQDLDDNGTKYQFEFARFRVVNSVITDFKDTRTFLDFSSIYSQISENFEELFNQKENEADTLLDDIQEELQTITDRSGFLLKNEMYTIHRTIILSAKPNKVDELSEDFEMTQDVFDYPNGFNSENCEVLLFQRRRNDGKVGYFPKVYGNTNNFDSFNLFTSYFPMEVYLYGENAPTQYKNKILVRLGNYYTTENPMEYTIILIKKF